jgi:hypothetical protein
MTGLNVLRLRTYVPYLLLRILRALTLHSAFIHCGPLVKGEE